MQEVSKHTDHVDVLFANAGATWGSEFDAVDEKNGWDKVMDVNVKAVFFTIQKSVTLPSFLHLSLLSITCLVIIRLAYPGKPSASDMGFFVDDLSC